jgi:hypothetical protein
MFHRESHARPPDKQKATATCAVTGLKSLRLSIITAGLPVQEELKTDDRRRTTDFLASGTLAVAAKCMFIKR